MCINEIHLSKYAKLSSSIHYRYSKMYYVRKSRVHEKACNWENSQQEWFDGHHRNW